MIQLCVDESYAFEYYCILLVKKQKIGSDATVMLEQQQRDFLVKQVGQQLFDKICQSDEFKDMLDANLCTFDMVDKAKADIVKASEVDACSFKRKQAKDALQRAFFQTQNLEVKIGYKNA